jgi:hypothetical protein
MVLGRFPDHRRAERARAFHAAPPTTDYWSDIGWWGTSPQIVRVTKDGSDWLVERVDRDLLIAEANAA